MSAYDQLVTRAHRIARPESEHATRRWLGAVASLLADWGGSNAASLLQQALPAECFRGAGTSGRAFAAAEREAGGDANLALMQEAAHRAGEPDPRNVGMTLVPLLGLVKEEVERARGSQAVESLILALPVGLQEEVRSASTKPPWGYRLIPQSYARPARRHH